MPPELFSMGSEDCHCTQQVTGSTLSLTNLTLKIKGKSTSVYETQATRAFPLWSVIWIGEDYRPRYSRSSCCASFQTRALLTREAAMSPLHCCLHGAKVSKSPDNAADKQVSTEHGQTAKFKFAGEKHNKEKIELDLIIISNEIFCSLYINRH